MNRIVDFVECRALPPDATACLDVPSLGPSYAYLLGMYLGDGMITAAPRRVFRLRIVLDKRYPYIIEQCAEAMREVSGTAAGSTRRVGCFEIYSNWKHWVCAFPQHGPGPKHLRSIVLAPWQQDLVNALPRSFLAGLIHSDGCRAINRVWRPTREGRKQYQYPRYFFSNASSEIRTMFTSACLSIGIECRRTNERNLSVARRDDVALLDSFIGPKR
jgi:hypothetical protein